MDCFAELVIGWRLAPTRWLAMTISMTFEIVERFAAALAAPQRLAGGRTELRQQLGILRAALRTGHLLYAEQRAARASCLRRRDAVFPELAAAVFAHPVRCPGPCQHGAHFWIAKTLALQRQLDLHREHFHRRAAGINPRDRDLDP